MTADSAEKNRQSTGGFFFYLLDLFTTSRLLPKQKPAFAGYFVIVLTKLVLFGLSSIRTFVAPLLVDLALSNQKT